MAFTITTAGKAKYAAATNTSRIEYRDVRFGTGHQADQEAATALQTPITGAIYPLVSPTGLSKFLTLERQDQAQGVLAFIATDMSADVFTATEAGLFDIDGVLMAYRSVSTGRVASKPADETMDYVVRLAYQGAASAPTTWQAGAVLPATTERVGIVELATNAEAIAGTDGVKVLTPASGQAAFGQRVDIQEFTANGTWTKPSGAKLMIVDIVGGGGGSAAAFNSGSPNDELDVGCGGGGAHNQFIFNPDDFGDTEPVVVGTGGAGSYGIARASDPLYVGGNGKLSQFSTGHQWWIAHGGNGGRAQDTQVIAGTGGAIASGYAVLSEAGGVGLAREHITNTDGIFAAPARAGAGRGGGYYPTAPAAGAADNALGRSYGRGGIVVRTNLSSAALNGQPGYVRVVTIR